MVATTFIRDVIQPSGCVWRKKITKLEQFWPLVRLYDIHYLELAIGYIRRI